MQLVFVNYEQSIVFCLNNEVWLLINSESTDHLHYIVPHFDVGVLIESMSQDAVLDISLLCRMYIVFNPLP